MENVSYILNILKTDNDHHYSKQNESKFLRYYLMQHTLYTKTKTKSIMLLKCRKEW